EDREIARKSLRADTGKEGGYNERLDKMEKDTGLGGKFRGALLSLSGFEQVMHFAFGRESKEGNAIVAAIDKAGNVKTDAVNAKMTGLRDFFTQQAGSEYRGDVLRYELTSKRSITADANGGKMKLTPAEAIQATMMWRQPDGKRHMEGTPSTKWHYTQAFVDQIEAQLSPEAKALRGYLTEQYTSEYARLNPIYRDLYGVDLPQNALYSPLTVTPQKVSSGEMNDPVTGAAISATSSTPGALRTRGISVAEPEFRDSLQTYIRHTMQMEHWMAFAKVSTDTAALLNNRDVRNSIEEKGGEEASKVLGKWLEYFAQGGTKDAASQLAFNSILGRLVNHAASVALVGRASVLVIQSLQLGSALAEMPAGAYAVRLGKLLTGQLNWGTAMHSEYIQRRMHEMPPLVRQAMAGLEGLKPSRLTYATSKLGQLIGGADALFTAGTYAMVYDYQLKNAPENLSQAEKEAWAHAAAERSTDRVAQPVKASQRSIYENLNTSPLAKLTWAFASEARQKMALSAWAVADRPMAEKLRVLAVTWGIGGMGAAILRAAIRDAKSDDDDEVFDEKNWSPKRLLLSAATGPLQGIPVLGNNLEAAIFAAAGEYHQEGDIISGTKQLGAAIKDIPDAVTGQQDATKDFKDVEALLSAMGYFNSEAAAAGSLSHLARDLFGAVKNFTPN
ncbi:MAG: hypothetical protein JWO82_251, partial [Akkermansiaceae bacterium]|nr:hypothetical protein [Akkermansiaceae bacterium]